MKIYPLFQSFRQRLFVIVSTLLILSLMSILHASAADDEADASEKSTTVVVSEDKGLVLQTLDLTQEHELTVLFQGIPSPRGCCEREYVISPRDPGHKCPRKLLRKSQHKSLKEGFVASVF